MYIYIIYIKLTSTCNSTIKASLQDSHVKKTLQELHSNFVISDRKAIKASSSVAIICKRFYVLTLIKELG